MPKSFAFTLTRRGAAVTGGDGGSVT